MRWLWLSLLLTVVAGYAHGQYVDPRVKAELDYYYENLTNLISGTRIITNTLPVAALDDLSFWLRTDGSNSPTADVDWDNNKITNLFDGTHTGTAATVEYVDDTFVPTSRTVTVNGDTQAMDANLSFTVSGAGDVHAFSVYCSTNFTIGANTIVKVPIDVEEFDPQGMFGNTNRFYPKTNGYYMISAQVFAPSGQTVVGGGAIYVNGSLKRTSSGENGPSWHGASGGINCILYLQTSDYVELYARNFDTDGSATFLGNPTNNWFSAHLIK